jgi:hypothetical protein
LISRLDSCQARASVGIILARLWNSDPTDRAHAEAAVLRREPVTPYAFIGGKISLRQWCCTIPLCNYLDFDPAFLQSSPKSSSMRVPANEEYCFLQMLRQLIKPKVFSDRSAMGNIVQVGFVNAPNSRLPLCRCAGPEKGRSSSMCNFSLSSGAGSQ